MDMKDRVALVTGSASGIGKQTAKRMAELGASVVINDINEEKVLTTVEEFRSEGLEAMGAVADICKKEEVTSMVEDVHKKYGRLDILVNNAGMERAGALRNLSESDWDITLNVNLKGAFLCCQAVHGKMVENKFGRIINIASRAWLGGMGQIPYSSAKAGIVGLTRTLALELAKNQITTNCVAPGLVNTPLWEELPEKSRDFLTSKQPTGRIGHVDDIANAVTFLASEKSSFINGQLLYVCGGRSLFSG